MNEEFTDEQLEAVEDEANAPLRSETHAVSIAVRLSKLTSDIPPDKKRALAENICSNIAKRLPYIARDPHENSSYDTLVEGKMVGDDMTGHATIESIGKGDWKGWEDERDNPSVGFMGGILVVRVAVDTYNIPDDDLETRKRVETGVEVMLKRAANG